MRHFLQIAIVIAVLFSNIRWQWTPNGYLAALLAGLAAYCVTILPFQVFRTLSGWRLKLQSRLRH